tara:strand:- start:7097 stop:9763 length:2667 start_codon:yes stop_codon:yes gene_type:complete
MAIQLKKYNQQVKPSAESGAVEGSIRTAGLPGQALAQAAEKVGSSIQQVLKTKNELDSRARRVAFDKKTDEFLVDIEKQQQDALLGQGQFAPTQNADGTMTENRIPFEDIESVVITPAKQDYENWLSEQKYTSAELNYINATKNKTFSSIDAKRDQVEFKRDVSQKKFDLEQSIISDTRKILEIQDRYGNDPNAEMSDADKATLKELTSNQQSNINFLKQISDPGDAEQVESLVLYQTIEKSIRQYQKDVAGNLLKGDERIQVLNKIRSQIDRLSEGGADAPLMGKHSMELNNLLLAQETVATDEIVTEYARIYSQTELDLTQGNFANKMTIAEELTRRTADMPEYLKNDFMRMVLGQLAVRVDPDLSEKERLSDPIAIAYERISKLLNGENVGLQDVYKAIGNITDDTTRELMWFVFSDFTRELGEQDSKGMYRMIYDGKGNKVRLDSETAEFWRQIGSYVALFEKEGMIQDIDQEAKFITSKLKEFKRWEQGGKKISFEEFRKNTFGVDANKLIEKSYRTLTFQDIYGRPGMAETESPYKFVEPDEAPTVINVDNQNIEQVVENLNVVPGLNNQITSFGDLGLDIVINDIPTDTSGMNFLDEDSIGFVGQNIPVNEVEAMYGPGATIVDGLVMFDTNYTEVKKNIKKLTQETGNRSLSTREANLAFDRRKDLEDNRALAVINLMQREMKIIGTGVSASTSHGGLVHTPESKKLMMKFNLPQSFIESKIKRHELISHPKTDATIIYKIPQNKVYDYEDDIYDGEDMSEEFGGIAKDIREVQQASGVRVTFTPVEPDDFDPDAWTIDQPIPMTYYPAIVIDKGQKKISRLIPMFKIQKGGNLMKPAQSNYYGREYAKALGVQLGDFVGMAKRGIFGNKYKKEIVIEEK